MPAAALAEPGDTCVVSFERGQELQKQAKPLKARAELRLCSGACPEVIAAECRKWLVDVEAQIGHLRVEPKDSGGRAVAGAIVEVDGAAAASAYIDVDPGAHTVTVKAEGYLPFRTSVDVAAGASAPVPVLLTLLPRPETSTAPPPSSARKPLAIGLGAVGAAAVLSGAGLLVYGKIEEGRLAGSCQHHCSLESVAPIERAWIAGGVVLGAGALLAAASIFVWPPSPAPISPAKSARPSFDVWIGASSFGVSMSGDL